MARQWLRLKEKKWFEFGHRDGQPKEGELALFCAGCPQPGINLTQNEWDGLDSQPNQPKLKLRSFVVDGNFSALHQRQRAEENEPWLKNGEGFLVERAPYQEHLATATEIKQVRRHS